MDYTTTGLIALLIAIIATGVVLRRRYGNVYRRMADAFEQATGISMVHVVRGLGILTLIGWAVVFLILHDGSEISLDQLWPNLGASMESEISPADPLVVPANGS